MRRIGWVVLALVVAFGGVAFGQGEAFSEEEVQRVQQILDDLRAQGEFTGQLDFLRNVVDAIKVEFGPVHPMTLGVMNDVAIEFKNAGQYSEAREMFEAVLESLRRELGESHPATLTAMGNLALTLEAQGDFQGARKMFETVLESRRRELGKSHPDTLKAMVNLARTLHAQGDFQGERKMREAVLESRRRELGESHPDTLKAMVNLARTLHAQGDFQGARKMFEAVMESRRRKLGESHPDTLTAMGNLALTLKEQGDFQGARKMQEAVLKGLSRELGESHLDTLKAMVNLATTLYSQGDFQGARKIYETVLKNGRHELSESYPDNMMTMGNLAVTLKKQGNLQGAREMEEAILEDLSRELGKSHPDTLTAMQNLAVTLILQGDLQGAREIEEAVLESRRRGLGESHPDTLTAMQNLAITLSFQGDSQGAREMFEAVLDSLRRELGESHPDTLKAIVNLAVTLYAQGDLQGARQMFETVLESRRRELGESHPDTLNAMAHLAFIFQHEENLDGAERLYKSILKTRRTVLGSNRFIGTVDECKILMGLADVYRAKGSHKQAAEHYIQFFDALESQIGTLALADESRSVFKSRWKRVYRNALNSLLVVSDKAVAHHVLERFRTQSVLTMMAERGIIPPGIPEELLQRRRELDAEYDRSVIELDNLNPKTQTAAFVDVLKRQKQVRRQHDLLRAQIRRLAPEAAEIENPKALNVVEIRAVLPPRTLALSFMVGPNKTELFVLSRDQDVTVHEIDVAEITLWQQMLRLFEQLDATTATKTGASHSAMASWFYDKLFPSTVAERIRKSERLLIIPDGPLFYLPFSALVDPDGKLLAETIPVHTAVSFTVYAQLQKRRPQEDVERPIRLAAFGDPSYSAGSPAPEDVPREKDRSVRGIFQRSQERQIKIFGGELPRIPHSGREVVEIGKLYGVEPYVGADATEEKARVLGEDVDIVHFAAHGMADPLSSLNSFIALTVTKDPKRQNGLLQAWEIYDRLRLNADLVVLSACQTAFGPERAGEGLISLTRAFQVAGARTVVASLWNVNDESTAELMIRFHKHLRSGKTKDEALRAAQLEFIHGDPGADGKVYLTGSDDKEPKDYSSPYYWAAFQVIGDYK